MLDWYRTNVLAKFRGTGHCRKSVSGSLVRLIALSRPYILEFSKFHKLEQVFAPKMVKAKGGGSEPKKYPQRMKIEAVMQDDDFECEVDIFVQMLVHLWESGRRQIVQKRKPREHK